MPDIKKAKRIAILGNGGSGKSTLAENLGRILNLPVIHFDQHFWQPGWVMMERGQWHIKHKQLISRDEWIVDGNYVDSIDSRFDRADAAIYLDFNRLFCIYRVVKRIITSYGKVRNDMADGCPEKIDIEFIKWIWDYNKNNKDIIMRAIENHSDSIKAYILKSGSEVDSFVNNFK